MPFYCLRPIVNSPSKLPSHLEKTRVREGWGRFARPGDKIPTGDVITRNRIIMSEGYELNYNQPSGAFEEKLAGEKVYSK